MEIIQMPVISTGHITLEVCRRLGAGAGQTRLWCPVAKYEDYGFFLYLDEPSDYTGTDPVPTCLMDIANWLKAQGFKDCWVRLDCDAAPVPGLPYYDW